MVVTNIASEFLILRSLLQLLGTQDQLYHVGRAILPCPYDTGPSSKVLLLLWSKPDLVGWHFVELFSGQGNVSAAFKECGFKVASYDMIHGGKCMDFLSDAGFASMT